MDKRALITGGSRGIGLDTRRLLEARGWTVESPSRSIIDFADPTSIVNYELELITCFQHDSTFRFEALIFCHGEWYSRSPFEERRDPAIAWYRQYTMRVFSPIHLINFFLRSDPRRRPKSVVMISSTRGLIGGVDTAPYSAACAAQIALMQGYAREYPEVRFNALAVGLTDTDMGRQVIATGGCKPDAIAQPPEAVASAIVSLIEDGTSNGRVVRVVDGKANDMTWEVIDNG